MQEQTHTPAHRHIHTEIYMRTHTQANEVTVINEKNMAWCGWHLEPSLAASGCVCMCKFAICACVLICLCVRIISQLAWTMCYKAVCLCVCVRVCVNGCACDRVMMRLTLFCKAWCVSFFAATFSQKANFKPKLTLRKKPRILHYINRPCAFLLTQKDSS